MPHPYRPKSFKQLVSLIDSIIEEFKDVPQYQDQVTILKSASFKLKNNRQITMEEYYTIEENLKLNGWV